MINLINLFIKIFFTIIYLKKINNEKNKKIYNKRNQIIIIYQETNFLGDYIYLCLYNAFHFNYYYNCKIYILYNDHINTNKFKILNDIFKPIINKYIHINEFKKLEIKPDLIITYNKIDKFLKKYNSPIFFIKSTLYLDLDSNYKLIYNFNHINLLHINFSIDIQTFFKLRYEKFFFNFNKYNIYKNNILVNIGSYTRNKGINNNLLYQKRIDKVIKLNKSKKFILLGLKHELLYEELTKNTNIINLIDKTNINDLICLFFQNNLIISRSTFLLHLSGLTNINTISLDSGSKIFENILKVLKIKKDIEKNDTLLKNNYLFYKNKWHSLSKNQISIIEFKKYNNTYNNKVYKLISQYLDYFN